MYSQLRAAADALLEIRAGAVADGDDVLVSLTRDAFVVLFAIAKHVHVDGVAVVNEGVGFYDHDPGQTTGEGLAWLDHDGIEIGQSLGETETQSRG